VIRWNDGRVGMTYHGASLQNPAFDELRRAFSIKDRAKTAKAELTKLDEAGVPDLPEWTTIAGVQEAIRDWEYGHPASCERRRDEGQFFGFSQVGQGYLGRYTDLLYIPAVRDAADDAAENRRSVFSTLLDLVVRSVMSSREDIMQLQTKLDQEYQGLIAPENNPELQELQDGLTDSLAVFAPDASVELEWLPPSALSLPMPKAEVRLVEDGYAAPVDRCGHGLQRTFVLTMLQQLALAQEQAAETSAGESNSDDSTPSPLSNLVLVIEEPELYQHPSRQRHFAKVLRSLAHGETPGVAEATQVVYATHSPLFVGIDRIEQLRLLRKHTKDEGRPKITQVVTVDLEEVAVELWHAAGEPGQTFTAETLRPRLAALMTPWMNEGFFARVAVLVEGEDDRAALLGTAQAMGHDLPSVDVAVIPCHGKASLDRPAAIFRRLGIPVFLVWDSDEGQNDAQPEANHLLLRLLGRQPVDWPAGVEHDHACFANCLEDTLRAEIGSVRFDELLGMAQSDLGILKKKHALKNSDVVARVIHGAAQDGHVSVSLQSIIERVMSFL
jgi:putative ATP-dependent endonuclease of the OLD family